MQSHFNFRVFVILTGLVTTSKYSSKQQQQQINKCDIKREPFSNYLWSEFSYMYLIKMTNNINNKCGIWTNGHIDIWTYGHKKLNKYSNEF